MSEITVKPLEWEPHFYAKTDELVSLTADLPGREQAYKIEPVTANYNFRLLIEGREVPNETTVYWPLDEAKARAQSDFDARIRSALVERKAEPVAFTLAALQAAHVERQEEWCPDQKPDLSFRGNEMAGEVGEACNVVKKLERERHGWRGSRATKEQLAEELADVIHCAVLTAITAGIEIEPAVIAKFNATSEKNGLATMLSAPPASQIAFECSARKQSLPEPADCDWPFCGCDPYADKVIAALQECGWPASQPISDVGAVKIVPIEPTAAMIDAANESEASWKSIWPAMLAAAPLPPSRPQPASTALVERLTKALEQIASVKPEVSNERFRFFALATADAALSLPENAEDRSNA